MLRKHRGWEPRERPGPGGLPARLSLRGWSTHQTRGLRSTQRQRATASLHERLRDFSVVQLRGRGQQGQQGEAEAEEWVNFQDDGQRGERDPRYPLGPSPAVLSAPRLQLPCTCSRSPSGPRGQVQAMPLPHTAPRPVQLQSPPTYKDTVLPGTRSVCNQSLLHGPRRSGEGYPGRTVKSEARINTENAHQGLTALGQYGALSHTGSSQA